MVDFMPDLLIVQITYGDSFAANPLANNVPRLFESGTPVSLRLSASVFQRGLGLTDLNGQVATSLRSDSMIFSQSLREFRPDEGPARRPAAVARIE
jgi:hypothetical protein